MKEPKINYESNSLKGILLQSSRFGISSCSDNVSTCFNDKKVVNAIDKMELNK
jgi:hypothetical protein